MKKLFILLVSLPFALMAQTDPPEAGELFVLKSVSTSQMNTFSTTDVEEGTWIYNTTEKALFYFEDDRWINTKKTSFSGTITISESPVTNLASTSATVAPQNFPITGLGFKPNRVEFVAYANVDIVNLNDDNSANQENINSKENSFGYMKGYAQAKPDGTIDTQQVIYGGGSGSSINDISRFASNSLCIGVRYGNINGDQAGLTTATFVSFDNDGFTLRSTRRDDALIVIYTAFQ